MGIAFLSCGLCFVAPHPVCLRSVNLRYRNMTKLYKWHLALPRIWGFRGSIATFCAKLYLTSATSTLWGFAPLLFFFASLGASATNDGRGPGTWPSQCQALDYFASCPFGAAGFGQGLLSAKSSEAFICQGASSFPKCPSVSSVLLHTPRQSSPRKSLRCSKSWQRSRSRRVPQLPC